MPSVNELFWSTRDLQHSICDPNEIVSELLRYANRVQPAPTQIISELLFRSIVVIRDLRSIVGIPESGTSGDAIIRIASTAADLDRHETSQQRATLLECADMIRTLNIVMKSGVSLKLTEVLDTEKVGG